MKRYFVLNLLISLTIFQNNLELKKFMSHNFIVFPIHATIFLNFFHWVNRFYIK